MISTLIAADTPVTKAQILKLLGMNQSGLARLLNISRSAVAQWPDDAPIPEKQELRLRHELRPDIFGTAPSRPQKRAA
jgi:DNA-binding transcriptional regulator YiaG